MSLVPYALRPKAVIRKTAIERGGAEGSVFWHALAIYFVRGPAVLRANAIRRGLLGGRRGWQLVGLGVFLVQDVRKSMTRQPEQIATEKLRPGQFLSVIVATPLSRKQQKRTGITRKVIERQALADVAAAEAARSSS